MLDCIRTCQGKWGVRVSVNTGNLAYADIRREQREEVDFRVRAFGPDARQLNLRVVNISPHGLMARCETDFQIGDRIRVTLPAVGVTVAEVRWSLGGRIGCQFDHAMDLAGYYELVAVLMKASRS